MKSCPLCLREGDALPLEDHHLKTRRKSKETTERICRECHQSVHGLWTNQDLRNEALELDSVEGILARDEFQRALKFIRKVPPGTAIHMRDSNHKKRRR